MRQSKSKVQDDRKGPTFLLLYFVFCNYSHFLTLREIQIFRFSILASEKSLAHSVSVVGLSS